MDTLPYARLPRGRYIRLLRLLPSSDASSQIECELLNSCLDDKEAPSFEALSYCWGDATITKAILINGYSFQATINLAQALECLRKTDVPRLLWVDAICINQEDLVEQGAQVAMMWHIYAAACSVVVWLGPLDRDSAVAMRNFSAGAAQAKMLARQKWDREGKRCTCHGGDGRTHPDCVGVLKLIRREWFTRVWVLQEVSAARNIVIACGSMTVSGEQFYREITGVAFFYRSMEGVLKKIRPALECMNRSERTSPSNKELSLIELIESFKTWKATLPMDKVYALLGMSSDASSSPDLQPDYTISLEQLAQKLIKFAFPSAIVEVKNYTGTPGEVSFQSQGLLLGQLGGESSGPGARAWSIDGGKSDLPGAMFNQKVMELFDSDNRWAISMTNERKLREGAAVVLLRGATRPSLIVPEGNGYRVDILATPKPSHGFSWVSWLKNTEEEGSRWNKALDALSLETSGLMHFKLSWNPFRAPLPEEISHFMPSPTDVHTQWDAMMETIKDAADMGDEERGNHDCHTMSMLWIMYKQDEENLKNGTSKYSITIHQAAYFGYVSTLKLLLDSGADVDTIHPDLQTTALHTAATQGHARIVEELLYAGANMEILDQNGSSALQIAICQQHTDIVKLLLDFGAKTVPPVRSRGNTYLIFPSIMNLTDIVIALIKAGADPNVTDNLPNMHDITPLHMAAEMGHVEVVRVLLDAGANVNAKTSKGTTPLVQSAMNGHVGVAKLLLERGAHVNAQQVNGTTSWDIAVYRGQTEVAAVLQGAGGVRNVFFDGEDLG